MAGGALGAPFLITRTALGHDLPALISKSTGLLATARPLPPVMPTHSASAATLALVPALVSGLRSYACLSPGG